MNERQPGVRKLSAAEIEDLTRVGQQSPNSSKPSGPQPQAGHQERHRAPSFQGHGFGEPRPAPRRQAAPRPSGVNVSPDQRQPAQSQSASWPVSEFNIPGHSGRSESTGEQPNAQPDNTKKGSVILHVLEKVRDKAWAERSKTARLAIGSVASLSAVAAVAGASIKAESDKSDTPIAAVIGLSEANRMTFTEPDCFEPAIIGSVKQEASYILNYKDVIVNKDELSKKKKSKSYKPKTMDSFDDQTGAVNMQSDEKPTTAFSDDKATESRLPATLYDGNLSLGICNEGESMSEVVDVDGSTVTVDASKLSLIYDPSDANNKKAIVAYEKYAPKALGEDNPGFIADKEYKRIRKVVVPNEKDPALNNPKFDNSIVASTLNGLKSGQCLEEVQTAGRKYFEALLRSQQPDEKFTVSWDAGGFVMPGDEFSENSSTEKNVKIIDSQTSCETFTYDNPSDKE